MSDDDYMTDADEFRKAIAVGDDSTPLMARVYDPPPSHWGKVTSDRNKSEQYLAFLKRHKESQNGR